MIHSKIMLCTTESEYITQSIATQDLLPLCHILIEIHNHSFISLHDTSSLDVIQTPSLPPSKVFKDSNTCIVLSTTETPFKPREKHILIKYHHFHEKVCNGTFEILKISTHENIADIFTKPLRRIKFQYL
jgi:hypothetical protein